MRHMEIQRGKEGMKSKMFNAAIGATAGCTLRLLLNSIADEEKGLKHGIRGDAWFGSVRAAAEISHRGHEVVFQIKQNHGLYPKAFIEETLKFQDLKCHRHPQPASSRPSAAGKEMAYQEPILPPNNHPYWHQCNRCFPTIKPSQNHQ